MELMVEYQNVMKNYKQKRGMEEQMPDTPRDKYAKINSKKGKRISHWRTGRSADIDIEDVVNSGPPFVEVQIHQGTIISEETSTVTVHVTISGELPIPVKDASLTVSAIRTTAGGTIV